MISFISAWISSRIPLDFMDFVWLVVISLGAVATRKVSQATASHVFRSPCCGSASPRKWSTPLGNRGSHNFGVRLSLTKSRVQDGLPESRASTSSGQFVLRARRPPNTAIYELQMVCDPFPQRRNVVAMTRSTFLSSRFSSVNIEVWGGRGSEVKYSVKWRDLVTQHVDRPHGWLSECLRQPVHTRYVSMRWPQDCARRRTGVT